MGIASRIVFYIIPLVLLIFVAIIFFGQSGIWEETKDLILGIKDIVPTVSFGLDEAQANVILPPEHQQAVQKLIETINNTMFTRSGTIKSNCFAKAQRFPPLEETSLTLNYDSNTNNTTITIMGGAAGKQIVASVELRNMQPCIIAGSTALTGQFYNYYFGPAVGCQDHPCGDYYKSVSSLTLAYNTNGTNGNHLSTPDLPVDIVNDEGDNAENFGWLFTPDGHSICFFPTNKLATFDEDGLDNDLFTPVEYNLANSIPHQINQCKVKQC